MSKFTLIVAKEDLKVMKSTPPSEALLAAVAEGNGRASKLHTAQKKLSS